MEFLRYKDFTDHVRLGGDFPVRQYCNGWAVTNRGADVAIVNNQICLPPAGAGLSGETVGFSGNYCEIYEGTVISISFETTANPHVEVKQKVYSVK